MKNKFLSVMLSGLMLASMPIQMYANAVEDDTADTLSTENAVSVYAEGLISTHTLSCAGGPKTIYINAEVNASTTMSKIGFKNIRIQRLVNGDWKTEKTSPDQIAEDAMKKKLERYPESVEGGYYYRIVLDNYAKENTWWFPGTETIESISSNTLWIPG